jgi:SAM-dependent methyltransferase
MYNDIVSFYHEIFPLNRAFQVFLKDYLGEPGGRILDLGCGPGDYVGTLAKAGYQVIGIDSSAAMIQQAQYQQEGTFYHYSFTEINKLAGPFDCIYCVGNSLSYLPDDFLEPFLREVTGLLREGGHFLVQVVNWDRYRLTGQVDFDVKVLSDGRTFHRQYEPGVNGAVIFHTALQKDGRRENEWSDTLYPKTMLNLEDATGQAGLQVVGRFGDYTKAPFDPDSSPAAIVVAQLRSDTK